MASKSWRALNVLFLQEKKRAPHKRAEIFKAVGLSGFPRDTQEEVLRLKKSLRLPHMRSLDIEIAVITPVSMGLVINGSFV